MEVAWNMAKCICCNKETTWGNDLSITRSHISKRNSRTVKPNLRRIKADVDGKVKRDTVWAKCLRSGRIKRAN